MNKIAAAVAVLAVWALAGFSALGAAPPVSGRRIGGVEVAFAEYDRASVATQDIFRRMDRLLGRYFRGAPPPESLTAFRCRISADRKNGAVIPRVVPFDGGVELRLDESGLTYFRTPAAMHRLFALFLARRLGRTPPPVPETLLPDWMAEALSAELSATWGEGRIVRTNRYYPWLRRLPLPGGLPDFREVTALESRRFTGAARALYRDLARFLFNAVDGVGTPAQRLNTDWVLARLEHPGRTPGELYDSILVPAFVRAARRRAYPGDDPSKLVREYLCDLAEQAAFNPGFPYPAAQAYRRYRQRIAPPGAPPLTALPAELAKSAAAEPRRLELLRDLRSLGYASPPEIRPKLENLARIVAWISPDRAAAASERLTAALAELERDWDRVIRLERFLDLEQARAGDALRMDSDSAADFLPSAAAAGLDAAQREAER